LKRTYFMTAIDGEFCLRMGAVHTPVTFWSSRLNGVRLRAVISLQTLC